VSIHEGVGPDTLVPVAITDLTESEAKLANLVFDPLSDMAEPDPEKLDALIAEVKTEEEAIAKLIDELKAEGVGETVGAGEDESDLLEPSYAFLIKCKGETDQRGPERVDPASAGCTSSRR
jgi:hypothetical protein